MGLHRVGHDRSDLAAAAAEGEERKETQCIFDIIMPGNFFPDVRKQISRYKKNRGSQTR